MIRRLRMVLGLTFVAMGALGTMAGPVAAHRGTGQSASRLPPPGPASRPRRSCVFETHEQALPAAGDDAAEETRAVVESRMRRLVAEQLGVDVGELLPDVSLADDLAADSLDLLELAIVVETQFGTTLSASRLEQIHTFRDLVDVVMTSFDARQLHERLTSPVPVKARIVGAHERSAGLERFDVLTPYAMELITADVVHAGRGARLELTIPADIEDVERAVIRHELARLGRRGIQVTVHREPDEEPMRQRARTESAR